MEDWRSFSQKNQGALSADSSLAWWNGSDELDETMQKLLELLDSCGVRLHSLLAKLTADRDAADDLLQDLFLRLLRTRALNDAPNPEAYVFRSAVNLAIDWRKRSRRLPAFSVLDGDVAADAMAPVDSVVQRETTERVVEAMEKLSDQDRELISLRFIQGESNDWIAERFGSTPHRIRSRCSKAVARLRNLVSRDESAAGPRGNRT